MPDEEDWIDLDEHGGAAGPLSYGVYRVNIEQGQEVKIPDEIKLHVTPERGWCWPDGREYRNPFSRMLRCKRVGDLP